MSAISLKSITGITSITTPAGVDNQLTLHNNNTTEAVKLDIAGNLHFHNHLNITGVSTASNFKTGTSNLHNTGLNVFDLDVDGHTNLDNVSIAGVTTITGSGNALEIVGGLVRSRNTAAARFVANNGSAEGYFGWSSGVLTVGQAAATLSLEATGSNRIQLKTNGSERLRITGDGKTIISYPSGVSQTPAAILDVFNQGTTTQALRVYRNDLNDNTLAAFQSYHNALGIVDKMVITSRGRVGINTNNPQREIHVKPWDNNPATAVPGYIRIEGQGSDQPGILELYHTRGNGSDKWPSSVASVDGGLTLNVATGNNGAPQERFRITSSGSVNIGGDYTQTSQKLKVTGNTTIDGTLTAGVGFVCAGGYSIFSGNVTQSGYTFHDADSDTYFGFPSADQFAIFTAGSERLRINSSGQVLIGTNSSPDCKLHITNGTLKIETQTTFYSGSGENGENYPSIFLNADHSSGNNPAHAKITVRHSNQNTYSGDLVFMPQGYYSGSYGYQEVMRVSAYKRVGINETNPRQDLHVHSDTDYQGILINGNSAPRIAFARTTTTTGEWSVGIDGTNGNNFCINRSNDNSNRLFVIGNGQTNSNQNTAITGVLFNNDIRSTTATNDDSTSNVKISARNAAAGHGNYCIIGVSGNTYFGAGANSYSSNPSGNNINGGTTIRVYGGISSNAYNDAHRFGRNTDGSIVLFQSAGGTEGSIAISGSTTNYNTSSDYRLKENIVNITDGITRLKQLKPRRFNFIKDPSITKDGFIAHEVDSIVPEAVTGTKDETFSKDDEANNVKAGDPKYQHMDASKLIPLLTAALQEAITEIETLKTKVAALESS